MVVEQPHRRFRQGLCQLRYYAIGGYPAYRDAVYLRGAQFLQELRDLIGDDAFFAKDYALTNTYKLAWRGLLCRNCPAQPARPKSALAKYFGINLRACERYYLFRFSISQRTGLSIQHEAFYSHYPRHRF